jgi:hypothetical protein
MRGKENLVVRDQLPVEINELFSPGLYIFSTVFQNSHICSASGCRSGNNKQFKKICSSREGDFGSLAGVVQHNSSFALLSVSVSCR